MAISPNIVVRKRTDRQPVGEKLFHFPKEKIFLPDNSQKITDYRLQAYEQYKQLRLPSSREEAWRRTDLKNFKPEIFNLSDDNIVGGSIRLPRNMVDINRNHSAGQIILKSSRMDAWISDEWVKKGVVFSDIRSAEKTIPHVVEKIINMPATSDDDIFSAIARAFVQNGVVLYVPRGVKIDQPFHSIIIDHGNLSAQITNLFVVIEEGASASLIHELVSPAKNRNENLHIGETQILVERSANFAFYELQNWSESVWNFSHERILAEEDSTVDWVISGLGSRLTKSFITLDLKGKGSKGKVSGLTFTDNQQHLDYDTQQNHHSPNTQSDLIFKAGLKGESRTIWQGMIYVAPGAIKTDGYQLNRNLIFSPEARADSIPGLEILADDVRCSHGSSIGNVDMEQVFYLISRGIPEMEAKRMIIEGFFDQIFQKIPFVPVRNRFMTYLLQKL